MPVKLFAKSWCFTNIRNYVVHNGENMKKVLFVLLTLISSLVFADPFTVTGQVKRIYPTSPERVHFRIDNDRCSSSKYFYFDLNNETKKAWFSMLLAAATTGSEIKISISECPEKDHVAIRYMYQDFN